MTRPADREQQAIDLVAKLHEATRRRSTDRPNSWNDRIDEWRTKAGLFLADVRFRDEVCPLCDGRGWLYGSSDPLEDGLKHPCRCGGRR